MKNALRFFAKRFRESNANAEARFDAALHEKGRYICSKTAARLRIAFAGAK